MWEQYKFLQNLEYYLKIYMWDEYQGHYPVG